MASQEQTDARESNLDDVFEELDYDEDEDEAEDEAGEEEAAETLENFSIQDEDVVDTNREDGSSISQLLRLPGVRDIPPRTLIYWVQRLTIPNRCYRCRKQSSILSLLYCSSCRKSYHTTCYDEEFCHQDQEEYPKCESPTPLRIHIWVSALLDSSTSTRQQLELHVEDVYTKWFGVPHNLGPNDHKAPELLVWPRMHYIFQERSGRNTATLRQSQTRFPSLCSFFGETGAGKSTIIRALMRMQSADNAIEAPVSGNDADTLRSTSGDVHLYADPATINADHPIVYADCEGLRGDRRPVAADLEKRLEISPQGSQPPRRVSALSAGTLRNTREASRSHFLGLPVQTEESPEEKLRRTLREHEATHSRKWPLRWNDIAEGKPHWRAEIVRNLYPRFLYMFSDVVCYTTRNTKTTKNDLANLIEWASVGYDQTTNQRLRPSLIIVINNDDRNNVAQWCDTNFATKAVLEDLASSTWFEDQQAIWKRRGRNVKNSTDLLGLYYDRLRVISIPSPRALSTGVVLQQYQKLYQEIRTSSERAQKNRRAFGMKVDVESLTIYTEIAFEQLSKNLYGTLDFYDIIRQVKRLPQSFPEHFANVLAKLNRDHYFNAEPRLLDKIIPYLSVSLALELAEEPQDGREDRYDQLMRECNDAFQLFHQHHWRCEALELGTRGEVSPPSSKRQSFIKSTPYATPGSVTGLGRYSSDDTPRQKRRETVEFPRLRSTRPSLGSSSTEPIPEVSSPTRRTHTFRNFSDPDELPTLEGSRSLNSPARINSFANSLGTSLERPHTTPDRSPMRRKLVVANENRDPTSLRCVNVLDSHEKGHQFPNLFPGPSMGQPPSMHLGSFTSSFSAEKTANKLTSHLEAAIQTSNLKEALYIAAASTNLDKLHTNTTCLVCFRRMPIHTLPCKHSFCGSCIRKLGAAAGLQDSHMITLEGCPLHVNDDPQSLVFRFKPKNAGTRTLALDGGGVRGVLELRILEAIVSEVGFGIPIQELFDLAIGTSTGGIIALGLFKQGWSPAKCLEKFKKLVSEAFNKRFWMGVPVFKHAAQILYSHRYESDSINQALRLAFGSNAKENRLFGAQATNGPEIVKVGVIAMSGEDQEKHVLLSSYSRDWEQADAGDYLRREEDPEKELHTWEAARSTSAAPTYFKAYYHRPSSRTYTDGAMRFNNPVAITEWERRLVWPDASRIPADIIVSIGAGIQPKTYRPTGLSSQDVARVVRRLLPPGLKERVGALHQMYRATLDCENKFSEFSNQFVNDAMLSSRCHRLNIILTERPCGLDDVAQIPALEATASDFLAPSSRLRYDGRFKNEHEHVQAVAYKLRASLFYFDVLAVQEVQEDNTTLWKIHGRLCCRLSYNLKRQFVKLLEGGHRGRCQFRVRSKRGIGIWPLSAPDWNTENFTVNAALKVSDRHDVIFIEMRFEGEERWEIISGFPRAMEEPPVFRAV